MALSEENLKIPISKSRMKITFLKYHPDLPGAKDLNSSLYPLPRPAKRHHCIMAAKSAKPSAATIQISQAIIVFCVIVVDYIDGLVHDCSISSALAVEILQYCTKPSIWLHPNRPACTISGKWRGMSKVNWYEIREHFMYVSSQWEMMLQCNFISH